MSRRACQSEVLARFDQLMARLADPNAAIDEEEVATARAELAG
jgi:hypothetical protein